MQQKITKTLTHYAAARERAYKASNSLSLPKMQAISKIKRLADLYRDRKVEQQLRLVKQVEGELLLILPHPESRYHNLRNQILTLIESCYDQRVLQPVS